MSRNKNNPAIKIFNPFLFDWKNDEYHINIGLIWQNFINNFLTYFGAGFEAATSGV
ncbi:uncharacterized protein METZ01_LOCUS398826 [marine metagenome]|uniref:Uncharacterized protein n=1 Tax=marine metagenome TaxID=408172 RepID=A0A382VHG2_9ZZZZ